MTLAMVFPGQGSQSQGMQADLAEHYPVVGDTYDEASELLGYDLWQLVQDGPAEKLGETVVTQPAMLTAGVAAYRCWQAAGGTEPSQVAGHSLGEYTALVCGGAVSFADAMRVVMRRSQLMQDSADAFLNLLGRDGPLLQRTDHATAQLGLIKRLASTIAFGDVWHYELCGLERREALAT